MLKTVKNGCGIRVDPPPVFPKFPHYPVFFLATSLSMQQLQSSPNLWFCAFMYASIKYQKTEN